MPLIAEKWMGGLTYADIVDRFPTAKLAGTGGVVGPGGGMVLFVIVDVPVFPATEWCVKFNFPDSLLGCGTGGASSTKTLNADDEGRFQFEVAGEERSFFELDFRVTSTATDKGEYSFVAQLSCLDPDNPGDFPGVPPPPNKPANPTVNSPDPEDEWGPVVISWTTADDLAEVTGFYITRTANYPGAVAHIRGNVVANATDHPNYSYTDYIGADEDPSPTFEYTYTVTPYLFDAGGTPGNHSLGEESEPSGPIKFNPTNPPPPPLPPNIEIPDPDIPTSGTGGFSLGGAATIIFITNPAGLYTLVKDKTDDTLYSGATSIDVKIPDPFAKTAYLGE